VFHKSSEAKAVLELVGEGAYLLALFAALGLGQPFTPFQGLIFSEGQKHRNQVSSVTLEMSIAFSSHRLQRRIMVHLTTERSLPRCIQSLPQNPAFGPTQLRSFVPIFNQKAAEVRDIWLSKLNENDADAVELDVTIYMSRATLDIIGLAGWSMFTGKPTFL
jgi:hypothetical protein